MVKIKQHILIIRTSVVGFSSMSLKSAAALQIILSKHYSKVDIVTVDCLDDLRSSVTNKPDVAFIGTHSIPTNSGDDINAKNIVWVTRYLTDRGISCTGSPSSAHALEKNKSLAKQKVLDFGLDTSEYFVTNDTRDLATDASRMSYPMFVKPLSRGGGTGIDEDSVVHTFAQLEPKVNKLKNMYSSDSIVEEYLTGREFSVAILKYTDSNDFYVMPMELIAPTDSHGDKILSGNVKASVTETPHVFITDKSIKAKISELANAAFIALGAQDYGRIDIRLNKRGEPQFLEANLLPSILEGSGNFLKACLINEGISYEEAMLRIVDLALQRDDISQQANVSVPAASQ